MHPEVEGKIEDNATDIRKENYPDWCPLEDDYLYLGDDEEEEE